MKELGMWQCELRWVQRNCGKGDLGPIKDHEERKCLKETCYFVS